MQNLLLRKAYLPFFISSLASISALSAAEKTYRYYQFAPTLLRQNTTVTQLSEFQFSHGGTVLDLTGVVMSNPNGTNAIDANEGANKIIDGSTSTKWLDSYASPVLIFDFGSPTTIDQYNFATANDATARDPISWLFSGSDDGETWEVLDMQTLHATPTARLTYDTGFSLTGLPVITNFSANKTIVINGTSDVSLSWSVSGATSVSIDQGIGSVDATGSSSLTLSNSSDTVYTITATNETGTTTSKVTVRTVAGGSLDYRYYRFVPEKIRSSALISQIQLSEFQLYTSSEYLFPDTAESLTGGSTPTTQTALNLTDNDVSTKWLDQNLIGFLVDMGENPPVANGYSLGTANDNAPRDPVRWYIEGSYNKTDWVLVDNVTLFDFNTPLERKAYSEDIPFPGADVPAFAPTVSFVGDTKLIAGQSLSLAWDVTDAETVSITDLGTVSASGSAIVTPTTNTTYVLTATGSTGIITTAEIPVTIIESTVTEINYPNFDAAGDEIALLDNATILNAYATIPSPADAKRLRLNADGASTKGTAWFRRKMALGNGFETNFAIQLISTGTGADGMSFVVQNSTAGTAATPVSNNERGLTSNALNIAFDSYQNTTDTSAAMLRVYNGATVLATVDLGTISGLTLGGTETAVDLTKTDTTSAPYAVRVTYAPGDLDIYIDGIQVVSDLNVTLEECSAVSDGMSWVGFSARSGSLSESHDVTSWTLTTGEPTETSADLALVSHAINLSTNQVTLTWTSSTGTNYRITSSTDLEDWSTILLQDIPGEAAQTSSTVSFTPGTRQFFRVEKQ
ncbi:discoidin domain-containing protein [Luteolibacter pohnpeiensis]|uniref:Discoidin domain-containing protein n=1 Tax=Luteolibacter pohnpeiensis TaxID=454153 RepID=A0A934SEA8_9BACT|nr:discoidin domain-containing protein [Luteolibacter pohnpeiensis]MBK1884304.1 discoidin domain-containing protein [Luteolibacter pohnpeiensis]